MGSSLKDKKNKDKVGCSVYARNNLMVKVVNQRRKDVLRIQEPKAWRKRHKVMVDLHFQLR